MSGIFTLDQERVNARLRVLKDLVATQSLHDSPCPLLLAQLNELNVFCSKLQEHIHLLRSSLEKRA